MSAAETPDAEAFEGMHEAERETLRALLGNPPGSHMDMPSWVNGACTALIAHRSVIAEAEKRGAVKALRAEAERLHEAGLGGGGTAAHALFDLARRIESGEVTL